MRPLPWGEAEEDWAACWRPLNLLGGPSWTRTTDLTLIRGALSPPELRAHTIKENSTESIVGPPDRVNHAVEGGKRRLLRPCGPRNDSRLDRGGGGSASDWRRAVAAVSERRVAQGRALYTERSPAELYRGARSSERERYARQASRLGAERGLPRPCRVRLLWPSGPRNDSRESLALCSAGKVRSNLLQKFRLRHHVQTGQRHRLRRGQHRLKSLIGQRGLTEPHRMSDDALSNRQVWMDRWDDLADVAHVGRTHARSLRREINRPSQFLQMSPKGVGQRAVGLHRIVTLLRLVLEGSARCRRACPTAVDDFLQHRRRVRTVGRAHAECGLRSVRNDVGSGTAVGDDAVHARVVTQLLAQQPNVDEHLNQPVEGVDSFVGGRRGVGGLAEKLYLEPVGCQG